MAQVADKGLYAGDVKIIYAMNSKKRRLGET